MELRALIPNLRGVQRAVDCGCKKVKLNVSASRQHNLKNLNMTPEESVSRFADCVQASKDNGIEISGSISMPFGSPWEGRTPVEDVDSIIEAYMNVGITEISLSDTSGMAVPPQVYDLCAHVKEKYPEATWWLHFHNTRGLAIANILAAMEAGMTQFDSSFGGLGGCGTVRCFHPDHVWICRGGQLIPAPEIWVAVYPGRIPGMQRALAPPSFAIIPGKYEFQ